MIASNLGQPAPSRCANRRVAVTGVGLCTSQLPNTREFYAALESEVSPLFRHQCGADEELSARFPQIKPKYLDETAKYAILASAEAFRNAGLRSSDEPPEGAGSDDIGLVVGTFSGPIKWGFENGFIEAAADWDNPGVSAASSVVAYYGSLIGNMTIPLRISGPSAVFCNLDVAGTDAIGYAFEAVRHGKSRVMLAGGADAPTTPMVESSIERAGAQLRGEHKTRLASGAAMVVLEELESAVERGAPILGEVIGYETSTAGNAREAGARLFRTMNKSQVDCVVATGVIPREAEVLLEIFRDCEIKPPATHVSWAVGFAAAASSAMQAVASVMLLGRETIPPVRAGLRGTQRFPYVQPPGLTRRVKTVLQASTGLTRKLSMLLFRQITPEME